MGEYGMGIESRANLHSAVHIGETNGDVRDVPVVDAAMLRSVAVRPATLLRRELPGRLLAEVLRRLWKRPSKRLHMLVQRGARLGLLDQQHPVIRFENRVGMG